MIYVLKIIQDYQGAAIGTYRPQYRPLSAIRYLDVNPLPTRNTLFSTLLWCSCVRPLIMVHAGILQPSSWRSTSTTNGLDNKIKHLTISPVIKARLYNSGILFI
jgi:hypothetical protein